MSVPLDGVPRQLAAARVLSENRRPRRLLSASLFGAFPSAIQCRTNPYLIFPGHECRAGIGRASEAGQIGSTKTATSNIEARVVTRPCSITEVLSGDATK